MTFIIERCPVCSETQFNQFCRTRDRHYGIKGEFNLVRCTRCELRFLQPMLTDEELSALYPQDYYAYQTQKTPSQLARFLKSALGVSNSTKDPDFTRPGKVLDVGCGTGWFLAEMRKAGWVIQGVEMSTEAARVGSANGVPIVAGSLLDANLESAQFDYVRSNHSFEHMSEPLKQLSEMRRLLKEDGKLFIGVPNADSLQARMFGRYWWYLGVPVHTFTYSPNNLKMLLQRAGFKIEKITYNGDYSGVLGSLQIWANRNNGRRSHEGWLFNNVLLKVVCGLLAKVTNGLKIGDAIEVICTKANL